MNKHGVRQLRSWSSGAVWVAAGLSLGAISYGCGQQSFGSCSDNGTCASDGGEDSSVEASNQGEGGGETGSSSGAGDALQESSQASDDASDANSSDVSSSDSPADGYDGFTCDLTQAPRIESCVISDSLGVFVAPSGSDSNDGTMDHPFQTVQYAVDHASPKRVYVCDAQYAEAVSVTVPVSVYGGLACPGSDAGSPWSYVGGRATVSAPAGSYALHVTGGATVIQVQDMGFTAASATTAGGSSIAALVDTATVNFVRAAFTAGSGMAGDPGRGWDHVRPTTPARRRRVGTRAIRRQTEEMGRVRGAWRRAQTRRHRQAGPVVSRERAAFRAAAAFPGHRRQPQQLPAYRD